MGIPDHLTYLLRNLYASQKITEPYIEQWTGSKLGKGVQQSYTLLPCLFNLYAEYIMQNARLDELQTGIKTVGSNINNLKYLDDTTLMGKSEDKLNSFLMRVKQKSERAVLKLNTKKPKIMASSHITSWQTE